MAQSIPLSALLITNPSFFVVGTVVAFTRESYINSKDPPLKKSDNSVKAAWLEFAGYEPMKSEAFENDHGIIG